jgi:hypothetical protein
MALNNYCVTAVVLSPQLAKVMHLPEFTAVGMLGFARWIKVQYGSDTSTAQRLRPGALQPPPKLEMGSQRQNHTPLTGPASLTAVETTCPADHSQARVEYICNTPSCFQGVPRHFPLKVNRSSGRKVFFRAGRESPGYPSKEKKMVFCSVPSAKNSLCMTIRRSYPKIS